MKKTKKVISFVLAIVMMLSVIAPAYAGTLNVDSSTTVEKLIQPASLANLVSSLITDINGAKENITGTVLRFCFLFIKEESLQKKITDSGIDVVNDSEQQLAIVLLDWLNENLPEWTEDITEQSWYSTVSGVLDVIGVTLDLSNVNGAIETLYSVCNKLSNDLAFKAIDGDLSDLNGDALKNVEYTKGNGTSALKVIYALFQWLADNKGTISTVISGGISRPGGLSLGSIFDGVLGDKLNSLNTTLDNLPTFAKSYIYLLIDGKAEAGDISEDPAGDWGKSAYKDYSADELLAAAVIRLIRNDEVSETVSKSDADAALNKNFYELLSENLEPLFENYEIADFLNKNVGKVVKSVTDAGISKSIFNTSIVFTNNTFKEIFDGAKTTGILGQFNNLLYKVCELALTPAQFKSIGLVKGGNEYLNANLTKFCRYILPMLATKTVSDKLGYDFTAFTATAVKDMELKDMATAVLKLFFEGWFDENKNFSKSALAAADSLEDLTALAVYYTATNTEWLNLKGVTFTAPTANTDTTEYVLDTAAKIGLGALNYNADKIYYKTSLKGTEGYKVIINDITNWALNFIKGIPAVVTEAKLLDSSTDKYGAFYKLNVVLNELIDFSFYTNEATNTTFKFDLGMFITDTFLDNLYDFDLEGVLNCLKINTLSTNSLYKKNVVNSVLQVVDRIVTALFKTSCTSATKTGYSKKTAVGTKAICTKQNKVEYTYCAENGYYLAAPNSTTLNDTTHDYKVVESVAKGATCKEYGYTVKVCTTCGYNTGKVANTATGNHTWKTTKTVAATCQKQAYTIQTCSVCGKTQTVNSSNKALGAHTYVNGKCSVCGAAEPTKEVTYKLGDIDNDGNVKAADARLALRASVGLKGDKDTNKNALDFTNKESREFKAADVNKDGAIKSSDARLILRASVGIKDKEFA